MSGEHRALLLDSVGRMLDEQCSPEVVAAAEHSWPQALWTHLEDAGLPLAAVPENAGGGGADLGDSFAIARLAAAHAAPGPLIETTLAGLMLAEHGLQAPPGPLGLAWGPGLRASRRGDGWVLDGGVARIPWGRALRGLVVLAKGDREGEPVILLAEPANATVREGRNLAFEPRDDLAFENCLSLEAAVAPDLGADRLGLWLALARSVQIAGAAAAARDLAVRFATERIQFGRPIGRFQAVQQHLAAVAAEAAAADAAAADAVDRVEATGWSDSAAAVSTAKIRTSQAAGVIAQLTHQVHGAIGFTEEHRVQQLTRRLWSWRDEGGSEKVWSERLGRSLLDAGGSAWRFVTDYSSALDSINARVDNAEAK